MIEIELLNTPFVDIDLGSDTSLDVDLDTRVISAGAYLSGDHISIVNNEISVVTTDTVESGNMAPVTSNAVALAIAGGLVIPALTDEEIIAAVAAGWG